MRLALVLCLLAAEVHAQARMFDRTCGIPSRRSSRGGVACSAPGFTLTQSYAYPYAASDRVPLCTDDSECVAVCYVGAVTGSTTAWECKNNAGTSAGTVTDPGGTVISSLIPGVKAREITATDAPSIVSTALDTMFSATGPYTVVAGGFTRAGASPNYFFSDGDPTVNITFQANTAGNMTCNNTVAAPLSGVTALNGWALASCRWNGASAYRTTVNTSTQATTDPTAHSAPTGGGGWVFGNNTAGTASFDGPLVFVAFYNTSKSDAFMTSLMAKFYGTYSPTGVISGGVGQLTGEDNTAVSGNVDMILPFGGQVIDSNGLLTSKGHTNVWAADALAAATWVDVGTPIITSNVSSGPFAAWKKAAECDLIVDDDAAAFEGKQSLDAGVAVGYYNATCFLKAGTSGTTLTAARISMAVTGGTGSVDCDFTGLTSTASRKECVALAGGVPTAVKASVLVGNTAAATGSVQACQCQLTYGPNREPPEPDNTVHGNTFYNFDVTAWANPAAGGRREFAFIPKYNPLTQWVTGQTDAMRVFDSYNTDHNVGFVFGYSLAGRLLVEVRNGAGGTSDLTIDSIGLTPGTPYAAALEWRPVGAGKCNLYAYLNACAGGVCNRAAAGDATTLIASDTTGTAFCPGTPTGAVTGIRGPDLGSFPTSLTAIGLRNYRP